MKTIEWTDNAGLLRRSIVPDNATVADVARGIPVGVDIIDSLVKAGMPSKTAIRLQNELRRRGLWEAKNIRATAEIFAALQSAYRADVAAIISLYKGVE